MSCQTLYFPRCLKTQGKKRSVFSQPLNPTKTKTIHLYAQFTPTDVTIWSLLLCEKVEGGRGSTIQSCNQLPPSPEPFSSQRVLSLSLCKPWKWARRRKSVNKEFEWIPPDLVAWHAYVFHDFSLSQDEIINRLASNLFISPASSPHLILPNSFIPRTPLISIEQQQHQQQQLCK